MLPSVNTRYNLVYDTRYKVCDILQWDVKVIDLWHIHFLCYNFHNIIPCQSTIQREERLQSQLKSKQPPVDSIATTWCTSTTGNISFSTSVWGWSGMEWRLETSWRFPQARSGMEMRQKIEAGTTTTNNLLISHRASPINLWSLVWYVHQAAALKILLQNYTPITKHFLISWSWWFVCPACAVLACSVATSVLSSVRVS